MATPIEADEMGDQKIVSKEPHADWLDVRKRELYSFSRRQQTLFADD
jgi:hypothetical protein